jgi:hypothetical protein
MSFWSGKLMQAKLLPTCITRGHVLRKTWHTCYLFGISGMIQCIQYIEFFSESIWLAFQDLQST